MYIKFLLLIFVLILVQYTTARQTDELFTKAMALKAEQKFEESFDLFSQLLKKDSTNVDYLSNASYIYSKLGFRQPDEKTRNNYYRTAAYLAQKGISINKNSAPSHFSYVVAIGRLTEHASNKEKIANVKLIKSECDYILKLNPDHGGAWHVLGRWNREIANLNVFEKVAINTMFGGLPDGGSYDDAINCFIKAIQYEPRYIVHYYELALTYYQRNNDYKDKIAAKIWLQKGLALPEDKRDEDYPSYKKLCEYLLKKVS